MTIQYDDYEEKQHWPHRLKRRNTKRWCRGKVGVEHDPVVKIAYRYGGRDVKCCDTTKFVRWESGERVLRPAWLCYHHVVCSKCKKELKWNPDVCPDNHNNVEMFWK